MTTADIHGEEAGRDGSSPARTSHTAVPSFPEWLLHVGASLHATLIIDAQGRIAWMDDVLAHAAGWRNGPPEGRAMEEVLRRLPWLTKALDEALTGKEAVCEGEGEGQRVRALVLPVFEDRGQLLGACVRLGSIRSELAEQRQARERLEHTISLLRATFESIADGVIVVDLHKRITAFNRRFQEIWGLTDQHLEDRDAERALARAAPLVKDPEHFVSRIQAMFVASEQKVTDIIELNDGRILERSSLPQRMGDTIIGRIWSYRDVTAERRAQVERERLLAAEQSARERLEESFALLDTFLKHAPIGLGFIDRGLRYIQINDALAALHGRIRQDEIGKTVREMTPLMAPIIEPLMHRVLESGVPIIGITLTGEVPATPGELRSWRVSYYPIRTASGGVVGLGAVVVEVTAERRAQAERERLLREAQEAIRVREDFLSIASHELKTPLTPLKLHLQVLRQRAASGECFPSHHVERALAQVARLSFLINDLLDTSRIQAGRLELKRESILLGELTREVLSELRPVSGHHSLEYEEPGEALIIQGDRGRLAQVLMNLLKNALKYSPTGGKIRVTVGREGEHALISVKDGGIGIPTDQMAHLFERFFRARNAPISGFGGLGLGLYICRDIIERHGGRIWVESEEGHGSTFRFTLPVEEGAIDALR